MIKVIQIVDGFQAVQAIQAARTASFEVFKRRKAVSWLAIHNTTFSGVDDGETIERARGHAVESLWQRGRLSVMNVGSQCRVLHSSVLIRCARVEVSMWKPLWTHPFFLISQLIPLDAA